MKPVLALELSKKLLALRHDLERVYFKAVWKDDEIVDVNLKELDDWIREVKSLEKLVELGKKHERPF